MKRGDEVQGVDIRENQWTEKIPARVADLSRMSPAEVGGDKKYDVVLHLAAFAKVFELVEHPERAMQNIQMTFATLDYCRRTETPIIFGSSREVYGDIHRHVTDEAAADFVVAESPYSASKISGEAMIYAYAECYGLPFLVFRFSNVYGRYDCDLERMERVVPLFIRRIAAGEPIVLYGPEKVLDFTYVDDIAEGTVKALTPVGYQVINLGSDSPVVINDVIQLIEGLLEKTARREFEPSHPADVMATWADIGKAEQLLCWQPRTTLADGVANLVTWYRTNRDWAKNIQV